MKVGSKWKCKVGTPIIADFAKWLLIKHLKEVHGLVPEKAKPRTPSIFERGFWHQDHAKMNVYILGDAMVVQRQNDEKVINYVCAKTKCEWDKMVVVVEQCVSLPKPIFLVKLISKQLLQVLGLNA